MSFLWVYGYALVIILGLMILLWGISLYKKNSSIVDIFWGTGFVILNWFYFLFTPEGFLLRKLIIGVLITIWGLRLSIHIFLRNHGKPEDYRYQKWREESGNSWWWKSFYKVFMLQGILLWIISAPLLATAIGSFPARLTILDFVGIIFWIIGFFFESVGDYQLKRFRQNDDNKGKVLDTGLWRYTRHPNYFGDSAQWWGYFVLAISAGGWWTVFSPILMTLLLVKVSGVALLEKSMLTKPLYRDYIRRTSGFIPWFPRKQ